MTTEATTIAERFWGYHRRNPHVYDLFKNIALNMILDGRKHHGAKAIMERIRFETAWLQTDDDDGFKINNCYTSIYVRLFERDYPEHEGFFRKCKLSYDPFEYEFGDPYTLTPQMSMPLNDWRRPPGG